MPFLIQQVLSELNFTLIKRQVLQFLKKSVVGKDDDDRGSMMLEVTGKPRENVSYPQTHSHTITDDTRDQDRSDQNQMYCPLRYFDIQNYKSRVVRIDWIIVCQTSRYYYYTINVHVFTNYVLQFFCLQFSDLIWIFVF